MISRLFKISLFVVLFWAAGRFCKGKTDGFAVAKIMPAKEAHAWPVPPPPPEISGLFQKPFRYLGKGVQSYVFASGDYVIKFIRHDRFRCYPWTHNVQKRSNRLLKDFTSYQIAHDDLAAETGLIYLHLNPTGFLKQKITIIDKLNIAHVLDLDQMEFIVQKRAQLVYPALWALIVQNKLDAAKIALSSLVSLLHKRIEMGIYDKDPDLNTNFGFIGLQAMQIDIGRFRKPPRRLGKDEIIRITDNLHQWLMVKCPELDAHLRKAIDEI